MNEEFNFRKLVDIREDRDLKQSDIAQILKISRPNYTRWETQEKIIPLKRLNTLCNYYQLSMDYVLNLSNDRSILLGPNELDKEVIGNNIRIIRKEQNLTLRELAKILNTTSSTISAYETGKNLILTAFAYQICKKYNYSMDWLCGRK